MADEKDPRTEQLLLTLTRNDGSEDRFTLSEYKGAKFLSIRNWTPSRDGKQWFPNPKRGFTIAPRDLRQVIGALVRAADELDTTREERRTQAEEADYARRYRNDEKPGLSSVHSETHSDDGHIGPCFGGAR